jgi:hypothetical protein
MRGFGRRRPNHRHPQVTPISGRFVPLSGHFLRHNLTTAILVKLCEVRKFNTLHRAEPARVSNFFRSGGANLGQKLRFGFGGRARQLPTRPARCGLGMHVRSSRLSRRRSSVPALRPRLPELTRSGSQVRWTSLTGRQYNSNTAYPRAAEVRFNLGDSGKRSATLMSRPVDPPSITLILQPTCRCKL